MDEETEQYVITDHSGRFYVAPDVWSHEYPDAEVFEEEPDAIATADSEFDRTGMVLYVTRNYGYADEEVIEKMAGCE